MSASGPTKLEPWAWLSFALGLCTVGLLFFLGWKPGGALPVLAYLWGPFVIGCASAMVLLFALIWSLRRRPVLQRGRVWPLSVLAASLWLCSLPIAYPSSHEGKPSPTRFALPFQGRAKVHFGGEQRATNRLLFDPSRRFGVCFTSADGAPLRVQSPVAGSVVQRRPGPVGEMLVLAVQEREFCVLEGLDPATCTVQPGDHCQAGAELGRARSLLFVHLQDGPEVGRCEGIPMRFWNYLVDGRAVAAGSPTPPQEVASLDPAGAGSSER